MDFVEKCQSPGQTIATSHEFFTPNGGLVREMGSLISGKSRLVTYYFIWPESEILNLRLSCVHSPKSWMVVRFFLPYFCWALRSVFTEDMRLIAYSSFKLLFHI